jgi:iron complex outermembrane receptor protein
MISVARGGAMRDRWDTVPSSRIAAGIAIAAALACGARAADGPPGDRVIVTGTHIPRTDIEGALPVQVIRRDEIERSGVTTVEQLLARVPANFNAVTTALTVGNGGNPGLSSANLRGLGSGSTLVLLNGRRLANYAFDGESVDLNSIPLAAIDRVEVLKDGASAIYGTDAIAGVINFVLKRDYAGATLSADASLTQGGGGNGYWLSGAVGTGDPLRDGYNLFAAVSYQRDRALKSIEREFARSAYRPDLGMVNLTGLTFPANIVDGIGGRLLNPSLADGCNPPTSIPNLARPFGTPACGYDYATQIDLMPAVERSSLMLRGTWQAGPSWSVFGEALLARNRFEARIAPMPVLPFDTAFGRPTYPADGPYYPADFAAANGLAGDLLLSWRAVELGPRLNSITADSQRYVIGSEGSALGWDFNVAAVYSVNDQADTLSGSYAYPSLIIPALRSGLINPWGQSGPAGQALLASTLYRGTAASAQGSTALINAFASRDIARLAAGPLALAVGAEARRERLTYLWDPALLEDAPVGEALRSQGGSRDVLALFAELNVPVAKTLDAQLAVRWDDYSDFGSTTNPKAALRWQPLREVLVRASWGTGFRAPPLYSLGEPTGVVDVGSNADPIRCPATGLAADCFAVFEVYSGGNPTLQPETSTQWTLGLVLEPVRALSFGFDYWHIEQDGIIVPLDVDNALRYHARFADRIIRGPVDPAHPDLPGPIVAVDGSPINLGTTRTSGVDAFLAWAAPPQDWGQLRIGAQGTYVRQFDTQIDGVTFVSRLGDATYGLPVPRWRSTVTVDWTFGPWGATLANVYSGGYVEPRENPDGLRAVGAASSWDLQGRYNGFEGWQLAAGIRNLLDADPPASAQGNTFQVGYNPQAANPLGRTFYLRATCSFK